MVKIQKHIEIIRSSIPELSSLSTKSSLAAQEVLSEHYQTVGISTLVSLSDLEDLVAMKPDLVFIGMKYVPGVLPGTKVWISGYLKKHGITHTGSPERAIKHEQNKPFAKQCLIDAGIKTSPYIVVSDPDALKEEDVNLEYPLFVKPANLGAGKGVDENSIVRNFKDLQFKLCTLIDKYHEEALIEEYLSGREFSVAVLKDEYVDNLQAMPIEMHPGADANGDHMLSLALKSAELETPVSKVEDGKLKDQIMDLAVNAFKTLGARDYGRIDIRLDAAGVPNFLEANLIPSIINNSGNFQKSTLINAGISYEDMLLRIVNLAFARQETIDEPVVDLAVILDPAHIIEVR